MAEKRGRPPLDAASAFPSADVHLKLTAADYDKAARLAKEYRESLQDVLRRGLKRLLDERGNSL